jgi:Zn-dependent protease/CBS domain-containing protein
VQPRTVSDPGEGGFLSHSLTIGTIAGTKVRLHWTFLVFLVWLGVAGLLSGGVGAALAGVVFIVAVFSCVVAHEFGHILTARHFGFASRDVTLLPIGGVARLQAIPERPSQELAVALAGPAVNLAIAALLVVLGTEPGALHHTAVFGPENILPALVTINLFLAAFNLLPAFPMDGGRALRAALAHFVDRTKATRIAASVGQTIAIGLGLFGLLSGAFLLIFIAIFVYFAAGTEAQQNQLQRLTEHLRVADMTVTELLPLTMSSTLDDAVRLLMRTGQRDFPVLDAEGRLAGVLTRDDLIRGLHSRGGSLPVSEAMLTDLARVPEDGPLDEAVRILEQQRNPVIVVDGRRRFSGLLTRENLAELLLLANVRGDRVFKSAPLTGSPRPA